MVRLLTAVREALEDVEVPGARLRAAHSAPQLQAGSLILHRAWAHPREAPPRQAPRELLPEEPQTGDASSQVLRECLRRQPRWSQAPPQVAAYRQPDDGGVRLLPQPAQEQEQVARRQLHHGDGAQERPMAQ
jgi:hypothetical protein